MIAPLRERRGPGLRRRRSEHRARRLEAGHVPPKVREREDPELARARTARLRSRLFARVRATVEKMLGPDADERMKRKATGEMARFLGLASGAPYMKKRRRKIRQATQRRNR